ncbi:MAG: hypothetical protein FJY81_06405 [Candidatus Aminicenantes bacterium]|nr:hypothetical protein [Candidatus Aminicenantes bacterium]
MPLINRPFFQKYLLPGFVFQGVLIAGGYGTGRELVEYFMKYGPLGGVLGMFAITAVVWALTLAVTFEFARLFRTYDYRTLLLRIIGPFWILFEALYLILLVLVLAVVGSAAGVLLRDNFGLPYLLGVAVILVSIGFLTFKGGAIVEKFMSVWSIFIYLVYGLFLFAAIFKFGPQIEKNMTGGIALPRWPLGGFQYALYNMGVIPSVLFCIHHIERRKEAILSGIISSVIGILPGFIFFIAVVSFYPDVVSQEVPAYFVLQKIGLRALLIAYLIVLFGTLIQTGTGFIHAFNQRVQSALLARGRAFPDWWRPIVAALMLLASLGFSTFGLISLVAKGYGSISWGIFAVFFIPLVTRGLYLINRGRPGSPSRSRP